MSDDLIKAAEAMVNKLPPEQQAELAARWAKRATPVDPEETQWQPGDYVVFKAGRRWRIARVVGFRRMCSESHEVMVAEPNGVVGGVRYGGSGMKLLERAPSNQPPSCDSYFHGRPMSMSDEIPDEAECLDCKDMVPITPERKAELQEQRARIQERIQKR